MTHSSHTRHKSESEIENVSRRSTLRNLALAALTTPAIGHWAQSQSALNTIFAASIFTDDQESTLVSAVDTLLPKTSQWGAVELGVPVYLLKYFSLCLHKDKQDLVIHQIHSLNHRAQHTLQKPFFTCARPQREKILKQFSHSNNENEHAFFILFKEQCIHGFKTTKEVMTGPYHYQIAPGHFDGCHAIEQPAVT